MPASAATVARNPSDLAWRVIGLVNLYRLLLPPMLIAMQWSGAPQAALVPLHPNLFLSACIAYFSAGVLLVIARRLSWPTLRRIALINAVIDSVALALILFACGGVGSGLGILLVLPVGAMAVLADNRDAFLIAAIAALGVLIQQTFAWVVDAASGTDYTSAGVLGVVLFAIVLAVWPVANRLRESEALVRRQEVDLANLAQLSQYIVQHLRESILVVDPQDGIRLINESAAQILGDRNAFPGALLGEASPRLVYLLESWRKNPGGVPDTTHTFVAADGARIIRPHFASLGTADPAPVLIFLEDTSLIAEQVQKSKLAALGRLSASIAHEIRNPVGAMSHASQLLSESPHLTGGDLRLTEIIRGNAERVSAIIGSVLQLSKREETHRERLPLLPWIEEFCQEFGATMQLPPGGLEVLGETAELEVRADPTQLRQIVWNLCENALKHAATESSGRKIEIRYGRLSPGARPYLEVADRGPGIAPENAERIFEPFFTGNRGGTGLGLFLARELAQTNGATLLHEARPGGGSLFRLVFSDPRRWELV